MSINITEQDKSDLLNYKNVHSVGIGYKTTGGKKTNELSVIVSVDKKESLTQLKDEDIIPSHIRDITTDVVPIGISSPTETCLIKGTYGCHTHEWWFTGTQGGTQVKAMDDTNPVYGSLGTLGAICRDHIDSKIVGLSNAHVTGYTLDTQNSIIDSNNTLIDNITFTDTSTLPSMSYFTGVTEITSQQVDEPGWYTLENQCFAKGKRTAKIIMFDQLERDSNNHTAVGLWNYIDASILDMSLEANGTNGEGASDVIRQPSPIVRDTVHACPFIGQAPVYDFSNGDLTDLLGKTVFKSGRTTGSSPIKGAPGDNPHHDPAAGQNNYYCKITEVDRAITLYVKKHDTDSNQDIFAYYDDCIGISLIRPDGTVAPYAEGAPGDGGDSGSCWWVWNDNNNRWEIIGLNFAGSSSGAPETEPRIATACRIDHVMSTLCIGDDVTWDTTGKSVPAPDQIPSGQNPSSYSELTATSTLWDNSITIDSTDEYIRYCSDDGLPVVYKKRANSGSDPRASIHTHVFDSDHWSVVQDPYEIQFYASIASDGSDTWTEWSMSNDNTWYTLDGPDDNQPHEGSDFISLYMSRESPLKTYNITISYADSTAESYPLCIGTAPFDPSSEIQLTDTGETTGQGDPIYSLTPGDTNIISSNVDVLYFWGKNSSIPSGGSPRRSIGTIYLYDDPKKGNKEYLLHN